MSGSAQADSVRDEPLALIIGECVYDVKAVERILTLKGFRLIMSYDALPPLARTMIPAYPPKSGRLSHIVPHPSFLKKDGLGYAAVANAGGKDKIAETLFGLIGARDPEDVSCLRSVTILADMDDKTAAKNENDIQKQLSKCFRDKGDDINVDSFVPKRSFLFGELQIPAFLYLFPDCRNQGALEKLLLAGAEKNYPKLLDAAKHYVSEVKKISGKNPLEKYSFSDFDKYKATVGCMASALRPGRGYQVSVSDDNWLTNDTLKSVESHKRFSDFLDKILASLNP